MFKDYPKLKIFITNIGVFRHNIDKQRYHNLFIVSANQRCGYNIGEYTFLLKPKSTNNQLIILIGRIYFLI